MDAIQYDILTEIRQTRERDGRSFFLHVFRELALHFGIFDVRKWRHGFHVQVYATPPSFLAPTTKVITATRATTATSKLAWGWKMRSFVVSSKLQQWSLTMDEEQKADPSSCFSRSIEYDSTSSYVRNVCEMLSCDPGDIGETIGFLVHFGPHGNAEIPSIARCYRIRLISVNQNQRTKWFAIVRGPKALISPLPDFSTFSEEAAHTAYRQIIMRFMDSVALLPSRTSWDLVGLGYKLNDLPLFADPFYFSLIGLEGEATLASPCYYIVGEYVLLDPDSERVSVKQVYDSLGQRP